MHLMPIEKIKGKNHYLLQKGSWVMPGFENKKK